MGLQSDGIAEALPRLNPKMGYYLFHHAAGALPLCQDSLYFTMNHG